MCGFTDEWNRTLSKDRTSSMDPRDRSRGAYRRTLDDAGRHLFTPPPTDPYDALMRCAPGKEPVEFDHNALLAEAIDTALITLSHVERVSWDTNPTPVREVALWLGVSKSTVQRARLSAQAKLAEQLVDWV